MNQIKKNTAIFIIALLVLAGGVYFSAKSEPPEAVFCTLDAKICPDGSYVGRIAPSCQFAACPAWDPWAKLKYISAVDWPPQIQIINEPFSCLTAGERTARAGRTEPRLIGDRTFCVTEVAGAAAGSLYIQYAYAFPKGGQTEILTFSLRFPHCGNYSEPARTECEREEAAFEAEKTADNAILKLSTDYPE